MTTDRITVLRERAVDQPIFATTGLPDTIDMLTVQVRRGPSEDLGDAVAVASATLEQGLIGSEFFDRYRFRMLVTGSTFTRERRLTVLLARRSSLWERMERDGAALPAGPRSEVEFDYPESTLFGFGGVVELPAGAVPAAVEITRTGNAVCLAGDPGVDPAPLLFGGSLALVDGRPPRLVTAGVRLVGDGTCAMAVRGFGAFDDRDVGVDVFADAGLLDALEPALRAAVAAG